MPLRQQSHQEAQRRRGGRELAATNGTPEFLIVLKAQPAAPTVAAIVSSSQGSVTWLHVAPIWRVNGTPPGTGLSLPNQFENFRTKKSGGWGDVAMNGSRE